MRAARYDIVVETGAYFVRQIQCLTPGQPILCEDAIVGERYYVDGTPLVLYSVEQVSGGRVRLTFNKGLYDDPSIVAPASTNIYPAEAVAILDMEASFSWPQTDVDGNETLAKVDIPVVIAADSMSASLEIDAATTTGWNIYEGAHSWDCYAQTPEWDWQRILEGTLSVICGDTR